MGNGTHSEGKDGSTAAAKGSSEANCADVQVAWQQSCGGDDNGGEHGPEEEALESDGNGREQEGWHKPEEEFETHANGKVDLRADVNARIGIRIRGSARTMIASFSPILGVMNPSTTLPTAIPSQKPVAVIPLANAPPSLTLIMKVVIQPPSPTSVPT